jgi:hypothetical protein
MSTIQDHTTMLEHPGTSESGMAPLSPAFPLAELRNARRDPDFFANRAILAMRNDQLPPLNDRLMDQLPGDH